MYSPIPRNTRNNYYVMFISLKYFSVRVSWDICTVVRVFIRVQYNTTLLSLCREICLLARHLHKTFNTFNNKTSTTQWNTECCYYSFDKGYVHVFLCYNGIGLPGTSHPHPFPLPPHLFCLKCIEQCRPVHRKCAPVKGCFKKNYLH